MKIKILLGNISKIRWSNLWMFFKLNKECNGILLCPANFNIEKEKTAKISIQEKMIFNLNRTYSKPNSNTDHGVIIMRANSQINVSGNFDIFAGHHIALAPGAILNLGSGYINYNLKIRCFNSITIGENVAISENVTIWDSDAHKIIGKETEMSKPIHIGDHVWIGCNVTILKGVTIGNGAVVAAGSVITSNVPENSLVGGVPAKLLKENVFWE
ncbi:MAG: Galactoside O-acetyltransferase [Bacteroidota bacterium]|jgi:acetyltransferase-like isoleucine patch superfamily enzyme